MNIRAKANLPSLPRFGKSSSWYLGMTAVILTTAIWGYSTVGIEQTVATIPPVILMWLRFAIATLLLVPVFVRTRLSRKEWLIGLGTGGAFGAAVLAQSLGLKTMSVDVVSFVTGLYVVFTPLAVSLIHKRFPQPVVWWSVAASVGGVVLLIGHLSFGTSIGLWWAFFAALASTAQILGTSSLAKTAKPFPSAALQSLGALLVLSFVGFGQGLAHPAIYHGLFRWTPGNWAAIAYQGVMSQVVACCLQVWGQRRISATDAALGFNLEPAMAAVFAWFLLHQGMSAVQIVGAVLILGSLSLMSFSSE